MQIAVGVLLKCHHRAAFLHIQNLCELQAAAIAHRKLQRAFQDSVGMLGVGRAIIQWDSLADAANMRKATMRKYVNQHL